MSIRTAKFNGISYKIDISGPIDGITDSPKPSGKPTLAIFADLGTRNGLETAIHEALHACNWSAAEDKVDSTARDLAWFLWRLGYRHEKV